MLKAFLLGLGVGLIILGIIVLSTKELGGLILLIFGGFLVAIGVTKPQYS